MKKTIKLGYIFKLSQIIDKINSQQINISAKTAFELYKLRNELYRIEDFILDRIDMACGGSVDLNNMSDSQKIVYDSVMNSDMEIDIPSIDKNEIILNKNIKLEINDMEILDMVFDLA
jgi:hypothetical protein